MVHVDRHQIVLVRNAKQTDPGQRLLRQVETRPCVFRGQSFRLRRRIGASPKVRQRQGKRFWRQHDLARYAALCANGRPQRFMASDHFVQASLERMDIQRPLQAPGLGEVVGCRAGRVLFEKPKPFLGERKGQHTRHPLGRSGDFIRRLVPLEQHTIVMRLCLALLGHK